MASLSVLITNVAATPRDNVDEWINRLYAWYAPRYFQPIYGDIDGALACDRIYDGNDPTVDVVPFLGDDEVDAIIERLKLALATLDG